MEEAKKNYKFSFGIKTQINIFNTGENEIPINNVQIQNTLDFEDCNSRSTIEYAKMAICSLPFTNYQYCKCMLSVFYKTRNSYRILSDDENQKLSEFNYTHLYFIKTKNQCDCEYKEYNKYLGRYIFEVIKKLKQSDDKVSELQQEITDMTLRNQNLEEDNRQQDKEISRLKQELKKWKKDDELKNIKEPIFENVYDIIININSIKNINHGWEIKFNEKGKQKYLDYKDKELTTIGVIGNINIGKSYVLSKIAKVVLSTGTSKHTEGLSIRYPDLKDNKEKKIILLDSAGLQRPVLSNNKKEIDESSKDKMITELFLQTFIINQSDILLIIVGELTYSEQLLINKIKEECKKENKGKIFIIHNLREYTTKEQVEK